jgi:hypothetical protein
MNDLIAITVSIVLLAPVPVLLLLAIRKLWARFRVGPALTGGSRGRGGLAGQREPRRPKPFAGAGAAALPLPEDDALSDAG